MKEKIKKFFSTVSTIIIVLFVFWGLSSCEKEHYENTCVSVLETFQDSDYYYDYYYNKCKNISDNEEEIEICVEEMQPPTTREIKEYCEIYEAYDEYKEYYKEY